MQQWPAMAGSEDLGEIDSSRSALLEEIGVGHDLTLVRVPGNLGDRLILAGTRALLKDVIHREIGVDQLPSSSGDTVLLCGSGAWCRPYHDWAPRALGVAALRFARVIVLPSSFDVGEDVVLEALQRTDATVFAREHESLRRIEGLCRARLAHDCAFFFDYSGYRTPGAGTLNAFRTDTEAVEGELTLADNNDISVTAEDLDSWLRAIAVHDRVRTDRAHVMIAAALLGKTVEFGPGAYHKVQALADSWLKGYPVTRIEASLLPRRPRGTAPPVNETPAELDPEGEPEVEPEGGLEVGPVPRVTVVILTRARCERVAAAVRSALRAHAPLRVLVIGNNPEPASRPALAALAAEDPRIELRLLDRNLGCAGGRRLASELLDTELVLFLDDDAELTDGALEHLLDDLDAHPEALGSSALIAGPDGVVQHCGGWLELSEQCARFGFDGAGLAVEDPEMPVTGWSGWLPWTAALVRAQSLREFPIDAHPSAHYQDTDWSFEVEQHRPGSFRRCREAVVVHHNHAEPGVHSCELARVSWLADRLGAQSRFLRRHGLVLDLDLAELMPALVMPGGELDLPAARLLLELIAGNSTDWFVSESMNGGLEPLVGRGELIGSHQAGIARLVDERTQLAAQLTQLADEQQRLHDQLKPLLQRHETLVEIENGGWWQLRERMLPLLRLASDARRRVDAARTR